MGARQVEQAALFYEFSVEARPPGLHRSLSRLGRATRRAHRSPLDDPGSPGSSCLARVHGDDLLVEGETIGVFSCYELRAYEDMEKHLEREMRLIRQLGAKRFEAQNLEMQGRMPFDLGKRAEAEKCLHEALSMCREVGLTSSSMLFVLDAMTRLNENSTNMALLRHEVGFFEHLGDQTQAHGEGSCRPFDPGRLVQGAQLAGDQTTYSGGKLLLTAVMREEMAVTI